MSYYRCLYNEDVVDIWLRIYWDCKNLSRLQKEIYGSTYSDIARRYQTLVNSTLEGLGEPK